VPQVVLKHICSMLFASTSKCARANARPTNAQIIILHISKMIFNREQIQCTNILKANYLARLGNWKQTFLVSYKKHVMRYILIKYKREPT
jgi:hypothetical protein